MASFNRDCQNCHYSFPNNEESYVEGIASWQPDTNKLSFISAIRFHDCSENCEDLHEIKSDSKLSWFQANSTKILYIQLTRAETAGGWKLKIRALVN